MPGNSIPLFAADKGALLTLFEIIYLAPRNCFFRAPSRVQNPLERQLTPRAETVGASIGDIFVPPFSVESTVQEDAYLFSFSYRTSPSAEKLERKAAE